MRSSAALSKHDCPKFVKVTGVNLNDGAPVDRFGCVDSFLPMLLIENAQMQRQTGAAVESFRNEMVKQNTQTMVLLAAAQSALPPPAAAPKLIDATHGTD
jgi:hypothetical protein